jgi:hypothetical protein
MQPCPVRDAARGVASQNRILLVAKMDPYALRSIRGNDPVEVGHP